MPASGVGAPDGIRRRSFHAVEQALTVHRKCTECEDESLARKEAPGSGRAGKTKAAHISDVIGSGGGRPLDRGTREDLGQYFGQDFSGVRVHTDGRAAASARAINALAYTVGQNIVFREGAFSPGTGAGRRLLAHELSHVVQQQRRGAHAAQSSADAAYRLSEPGDPDERQADRAADAVMNGRSVGELESASQQIHRTPMTASGQSPPLPPPPIVTTLEDWATVPMAELLDNIRNKLTSIAGAINQSGLLRKGKDRIRAALFVVKNERLVPAARVPEEMAEMRELLAAGSKDDRDTCEAQFKDAVVPSVPTSVLPPAPGGHAQAGWPKPLLEAIHISVVDRNAGMPSSRSNLPEAYGSRPTDAWSALTAMGSAATVIKQVYDRWAATSIPWSGLRSIRNSWSGSSVGFNFNAVSVSSLRSALEGTARFCKDKNGGDLYHDWVEGTAPCWRECTAANTPGLHFCVGGSVPTVHIDPHQVVEFRENDGTCNYDLSAVRQHFKDLGWLPTWL